MRTINLIFLAGLIAVLALFGTAVYFLHEFQIKRNASALLAIAYRAENSGGLEKAKNTLSNYLKIQPQDSKRWKQYAKVVKAAGWARIHKQQVFLVHEQALHYNPGDSELERECVALALDGTLARYGDAKRHVDSLIAKVPKDTQGKPVAAEELADLEELAGRCEQGLAQYAAAEKSFMDAIENDPRRVTCYDRLARLRRIELRRNADADKAINEMVAKNWNNGRAFFLKWQYDREFRPPAKESDLKGAQEMSPDDPEVLLTSARVSVEKKDLVAARSSFEKGQKLDPKKVAFQIGLAQIEAQENNPERAVAILQHAYDANPSEELLIELAFVLISQDKFSGPGGAEECISALARVNMGESWGELLRARILIRQKKWSEAIRQLEALRESVPSLKVQVNLSLAECYGHVLDEERRLRALQEAAAGGQAPEVARLALAQSLSRSGKLDQAVMILSPLAERKPEWRLDLVYLLIQKMVRVPKEKRNWDEVEQRLAEAEKEIPQSVERLALARAELLAAQERLDEARSLLAAALAKDPRNLRYRLAMARVHQLQGKGTLALQVLDHAEKDLGPSLELRLARLSYWGQQGGSAAKSALARMAEKRDEVSPADRARFLERLAQVELRLGETALARQHLRELSSLRPADIPVKMDLFALALQIADREEAEHLIDDMRKLEGEKGTYWRFARAYDLLDQARRGVGKDRTDRLDVPRVVAAELAAQRPDWWGSSVLRAEIAELEGHVDEAIRNYTLAIELGNSQPTLARRLVSLLGQAKDRSQIERVINLLSNRGVAVADLRISAALNAIRQGDFRGGVELARQVCPENSTNYDEHLFMGYVFTLARLADKAGEEFNRAVELSPSVPRTWVTYIQYLVREKKLDEAKDAVERARKSLPMDRANLTLSQCEWLVGEKAKAEASLTAALESPACDAATISAAVEFYSNQGRFDRVEPILDKLNAEKIQTTPEVLAWAKRARIMNRLRSGRLAEIDRALTLIDQNLKENPSSTDDLNLKAQALAMRTSRRGDAIKLLEPIDQANRLGANEQFFLAKAYLSERLTDKYRSEMEKLLSAPVKNPQYLVHFIDFLINRNELDDAERWLEELKHFAPQSLAVFQRKARLLDLRKRRPELLEVLEARARDIPQEIGAIAGLLERFGFPEQAEEKYRAFVGGNSKEPERTLALASFLARQDRTKESLAILDKAQATCPAEAVAATALTLYNAPSADVTLRRQVERWVADALQKSPSTTSALRPKLAAIYLMQGRYSEAESLLRQTLQSNPDHVETLNDLAWLLSLRDVGEPREALGLIDQAIEKGGLASSLIDTRAVVLIRSGEPARAAQELRTAQDADPRNVSLALHLAWAYQVEGKLSQAREQFRRAKELGLRPETRDPLERVVISGLEKALAPEPTARASDG
jgi:tetratricopeptide (TPR) repeat protein